LAQSSVLLGYGKCEKNASHSALNPFQILRLGSAEGERIGTEAANWWWKQLLLGRIIYLMRNVNCDIGYFMVHQGGGDWRLEHLLL